jgi:phage/plasmid-like protein (TIGR03299 family)
MAHELTMVGDKAEMAFVGETPWHGLGQELQEGASIEEWQIAAGMDWEIYSSPVEFNGSPININGAIHVFKGQNVLYRSDTKAPLSIVSDRYKVVQPAEVLEFFRDLVADNGFKIHTAGTLKGGKKLWALAETGKFGEVCKNDGVGGFLLLSTSCDRSLPTTARFTTVRVVCNNTLGMALYNLDNCVSFSHIQQFDHEKIKLKLSSAVNSFGSFMEMAKLLQRKNMSSAAADKFVKDLISPYWQNKDSGKVIENNRTYKKIMALFDSEAKGSELVGHTKWGMLNAVTEYYDHHVPSRTNDARLNNAWFGHGDNMKNKAIELLFV